MTAKYVVCFMSPVNIDGILELIGIFILFTLNVNKFL